MIATLCGLITDKNDGVVIECGGVGYGVFVTLSDFGKLSLNEEVFLYNHI